jgi:tripartite-type tricarboxylate transporter receptor subunit TctC
MKRPRTGAINRRGMLGGSLMAGVALAAPAVHAQSPWPSKPVRFIVPFPPGGTVDPLARLLGAQLTQAWGQQVIVDNRPGASGSIGTAAAAKSPADGYTFLFVFDTHAVNPALINPLPFDTMKDLDPIMLIGTSPNLVTTHSSRPFQSFAEVVQAAKAKPDSISLGTIGNGSLAHLTITLLQQQGNFRVTHVPYKGGGPLSQDAVAGHVDLAIATPALLAQHARAGRLRPLVVTGEKRTPVLPDVPSLAEQGFPGLSALAFWGVLAPTGVPAPILEKFHADIHRILNLPETRKQLTEQLGMELALSEPAAFRQFLDTEIARWGKVVREHNIKAD